MKHETRVARAAVAVIAVLVGTACGGDGSGDKNAASKTSQPPVTQPSDQMMDRDVEIEITGARQATIHRRMSLRLLKVRDDNPKSNLTSITIPQPIDLGGGLLLLPDVALFGPEALKQSTVIPAGYGSAPPSAPKVETPPLQPGEAAPGYARLTFVTREPLAEVRFGYLSEPCPISFQAEGVIGSVTCAAVYAPTGEKITFTMKWNA